MSDRCVKAGRARRGISLVELLVVVAIIGTLLALLLPAVQAVRESAKRLQCSSNLKQLGIALHTYHKAHGIFPPSMQADPGDPMPENTSRSYKNWVIMVLPYLEEQILFDRFNFKEPLDVFFTPKHPSANALATATPVAVMRCPSDTGGEQMFKVKLGFKSGSGFIYQSWARGNYAANGCLAFPFKYGDPKTQIAPACGWANQLQWSGPESHKSRGIMGTSVSLSVRQITDGTSKTGLLSEVRAGVNELDLRGTWANGNAGGSSLWGHYNGPNWTSDGIGICDPVQTFAGGGNLVRGTEIMKQAGMGCHDPNYNSIYSGNPKSRHPGGILVCMADGSVRFVNDKIARCMASPQPYGWQPFVIPELFAWERLWASGDGLPLNLDDTE